MGHDWFGTMPYRHYILNKEKKCWYEMYRVI
jgi:hypothetical protein